MSVKLEDRISLTVNQEQFQYNVLGFNQLTVMACGRVVNGKLLKINGDDLYILRKFTDLWLSENEKAKRYKFINPKDGLEYQQVSYQHFVNMFPFLNLSASTIRKAFYKYKDIGLLLHYHRLQGGSYSCYRWDDDMFWILRQPPDSEIKGKTDKELEKELSAKLSFLKEKIGVSFTNLMETKLIESPKMDEGSPKMDEGVVQEQTTPNPKIDEGLFKNGRTKILLHNIPLQSNLLHNNSKIRETESFPGIDFNNDIPGKEKEEVNKMEKFPLDNIPGKEKSEYEEKLYKEYSPVLEEFKNFGFSLKFRKESNTPKFLYGHFQALAAGEFKQKLKPEQREKLQDFRKLDSPQPVERLAKYIKKALIVFEKIRTDESYWPKDKSKLQKLSISDFLLSQKKFSWLMYCLDNPEPMERQDYQLSAVKKKFEKLKISELTIVRNLYNNHSDVEHFTEKQWTEVYFSLNSIFDYIEKNEEALAGKGAYETPRTFLDLMGSWNQAQSKMVTNFGIGSAPWQWFNDWLKQNLGFNMIVKKQREKAPEVVKKEMEFAAIEFFTETYNGFFRGEMKGAESAAIEARTLALTLEKFPGVSREVLRIGQG